MRKNIFEIIAEQEIDLRTEINRINTEISIKKYALANNGLEEFIDNFIFREWRYNGSLIDVKHFREKTGLIIKPTYKKYTIIEFLNLVEYVLNLIYLAPRIHVEIDPLYGIYTSEEAIDEELNQLKQYLLSVLFKFNYKHVLLDKEEIKVIVIENNPSATSVAEMIEDDNVSREIIRYNHFMLMGNLAEKEKILLRLAKEFENIKKKLNSNSCSKFADDCGLLFNVIVKHIKASSPAIDKRIKDMSSEELEEWYDKTYDLFLTCELVANYIDVKKNIDWLKKGE